MRVGHACCSHGASSSDRASGYPSSSQPKDPGSDVHCHPLRLVVASQIAGRGGAHSTTSVESYQRFVSIDAAPTPRGPAARSERSLEKTTLIVLLVVV